MVVEWILRRNTFYLDTHIHTHTAIFHDMSWTIKGPFYELSNVIVTIIILPLNMKQGIWHSSLLHGTHPIRSDQNSEQQRAGHELEASPHTCSVLPLGIGWCLYLLSRASQDYQWTGTRSDGPLTSTMAYNGSFPDLYLLLSIRDYEGS